MFKSTKFTIGEMARMHRIPESTLRYYDEKGIFHPAIVDPVTQYRYYTTDQFSMLDTVKFLRHLGIPLKQIKQYTDERNPSNAKDMLIQQKKLMEQKQQEIALMIMKMEHSINLIDQALTGTKNTVEFRRIPKRTVASMAIAPRATDEMFEYCIYSLMNRTHLHDVSLFAGAIGVTVAREELVRGDYQAYNSVFINVNDSSSLSENDLVIEEGWFACAYHHGAYDQTKVTYEVLLQEIAGQDYEIIGDAIELSLIDLSTTNDPNEYITEIQIPVAKRN